MKALSVGAVEMHKRELAAAGEPVGQEIGGGFKLGQELGKNM